MIPLTLLWYISDFRNSSPIGRERRKRVEKAVFHFYLTFSSFGNLNLIFAVTHPSFPPGREAGPLEVNNSSK